jgi:TetR/AcrR family transcriptional regulator, fatty acid metabolism regulator protein
MKCILSQTHFIIPEQDWVAEARKIVGEGDHPKRRSRALVHNRDREAEILIAARAVFEEHGFDAASVAEIARRSRVAEGTIYLYCANKRDLLQKVVARWYEQLIADATPGLAERVGARAKLRFFAERHLNALIENAAIGRLLVSELRSAADYPGSALHKLNGRYVRRLVEILRDGVAAGEILADARLDVARDLFFGALEHLALGGVSDASKRAGAVDVFMALFWRAIAR